MRLGFDDEPASMMRTYAENTTLHICIVTQMAVRMLNTSASVRFHSTSGMASTSIGFSAVPADAESIRDATKFTVETSRTVRSNTSSADVQSSPGTSGDQVNGSNFVSHSSIFRYFCSALMSCFDHTPSLFSKFFCLEPTSSFSPNATAARDKGVLDPAIRFPTFIFPGMNCFPSRFQKPHLYSYDEISRTLCLYIWVQASRHDRFLEN
mmetsp:Transcript_28095/g.53516  ORF Transcript_28095/g.53516 Transcript_28095/m.53516 type:complete len:209 (-) Transcript_28095:288-914(-)